MGNNKYSERPLITRKPIYNFEDHFEAGRPIKTSNFNLSFLFRMLPLTKSVLLTLVSYP